MLIDDIEYDSVAEWFWIEILGGCGCGSSEALKVLSLKIFKECKISVFDRVFHANNKLEYEIIYHWLNSKGLIEHGSAISGAWFTDKGKELYNKIKELEG